MGGIDAAMAGGSMAMGWMDNMVNGAIGSHFATRQAYTNYKLNEQAAANADMRQRQQYYDMYSIEAQMQQLKKAGLSPSLMYGNLPSVQGASGAQGSGASGVAPAFGNPANLSALASVQLQRAEARKANAEADRLNGTSDRGQAEINEIVQRTNNLFMQAEHEGYLIELAAIDVFLKSEYGVKEVEARLGKLQAETANMHAILKSLVARGKIDTESANSIIAYYRQRVIEQQADIMLKQLQSKLTAENITLTKTQVQKLLNDIFVDNENIEISKRGVKVNEDKLQAQIEQWCAENGLRERGQNIEIAKTIINGWLKAEENGIRIIDTLSDILE